jgi:probable phosphomutase (TIGR03848 family)
MTTLYLIRHGANDLLGKRLPGWMPGVHLNALGHDQAKSIARVLQDVRFSAVYASPLERTMETAAPLAAQAGLEIQSRPDLRDVYPGAWQGKKLASLRRSKAWLTIQAAPSLASFPQGESFTQAQQRVVAELERIRHSHPRADDHVAVFSHADIIMLAIAHYVGMPLDLYRRLAVEPGSISVLLFSDRSIRLLHLNDVSASARLASG